MYFITVMEKIEPSERFLVEHGDKRTWGYYLDKDIAFSALHEDKTHMSEDCYKYAVVENIGEGICAPSLDRQYFQYDNERKGFFEIDEPECVKHICNYAIG